MLLKLHHEVFVDPERVVALEMVGTRTYADTRIRIRFDRGSDLVFGANPDLVNETIEKWSKEINAALRGVEDRKRAP